MQGRDCHGRIKGSFIKIENAKISLLVSVIYVLENKSIKNTQKEITECI